MHRYQGHIHQQNNSNHHHHHYHPHQQLHHPSQNLIVDPNNNSLIMNNMVSQGRYNYLHQQQHHQKQHKGLFQTTNDYSNQKTADHYDNHAHDPRVSSGYDRKCLCCPYGFHIDLDFLRYLESLRSEMRSHGNSPRRERAATRVNPSSLERSAFSEDESAFAYRSEVAVVDPLSIGRPYVVRPKAEPDVLVAIPDELKVQRTELLIDPEVEKKFRASTQLFINNEHQRLGCGFENGRDSDVPEVEVKLRRGVPGEPGYSSLPRYRSSIAVVIEQLEHCLGASSLTASVESDSIPKSSRVEREDDLNQLTRVQVLCSKIIAKLRRLHDLEEKVRLIPDLDEHILSLTRQLDQLRMKQHQQKPPDAESEPLHSKARSRAATRDVGVGNAVVFSRGVARPASPTMARRVREVSVQVDSTPQSGMQTAGKMSETKVYLSQNLHGDHWSLDSGQEVDLLTKASDRFCCTRCGSKDVAKLRSEVTEIEGALRPFKVSRDQADVEETHGRPRKIPPAVAPKPKVSRKSLAEGEVEIKNGNFHVSEGVLNLMRSQGNEDEDSIENLTPAWLESIPDAAETKLSCVDSKSNSAECLGSPSVDSSDQRAEWQDGIFSNEPSVENHQAYVCKALVILTLDIQSSRSSTTSAVSVVEVSPTSEESIVPIVVDLMESSSESEEQLENGGVRSSTLPGSPTGPKSSSECLVSEITVEENTICTETIALDKGRINPSQHSPNMAVVESLITRIFEEAVKEAGFISDKTPLDCLHLCKDRSSANEQKDWELRVGANASSFEGRSCLQNFPSNEQMFKASGSSTFQSSIESLTSPSSEAPLAPHSSLADVDRDDSPISCLSNVLNPDSRVASGDVRSNLFADSLTSDVLLTTTSESSEAETWGEAPIPPSGAVAKERDLFIDSQGLFLRAAAAGKKAALSDPGDLWKKKSLSSELTVMSSTDDDDDEEPVIATTRKSRAMNSDELSAILEDKTSGSSLEQGDAGEREAESDRSGGGAGASVCLRPKILQSFDKVRPCSSGSFETDAASEFLPLSSPSSAVTSQSFDAGINEELASIRSPCGLSLKSDVPLIRVTPSSAGIAPPVSLGLSSDLSIFEEDDDLGAAEATSAPPGVALVTGACGTKSQNERTAEEEEDCFLEACIIYANWLTDQTSITEPEKEAIVELIRKDWFLTAGRKTSQESDVRNALTTMQNFGDLFVESVVNMADSDGNTTLHYAVSHGNRPVIEALMETGLCDADRQNDAGYTPIMLAALLMDDVPRNLELLKALFEAGDVNTASDRSGQTALMLASSHGHEEMVGLLLECGSDVNVQDEDGSTALMCASEHGHVGIAKALLAHPDCNSSLSDIDGSTALSIAMEEGNHDIGILIYAHMKAHGNLEDAEGEPSA